MKASIQLIIADSNYLIGEGLCKVFSDVESVDIVGVASNREELASLVDKGEANVLLMDYSSEHFSLDVALDVLKGNALALIGITQECNAIELKRLLANGLTGHLKNDCDREEIIDSVQAAHKGEKFFCGKVLKVLHEAEGMESDLDCDPVVISEREVEILQLIAQGLTTKQIAEELHLSFHTVMTHRKNMLSKLGLKNTAGLIVYAVRENLISPNKFLFSSS